MAHTTVIKQNIDCPWCGGSMHKGMSTIGAGLNSISYFCSNCGATLATYKMPGKKIKAFSISDFEFEDLESDELKEGWNKVGSYEIEI